MSRLTMSIARWWYILVAVVIFVWAILGVMGQSSFGEPFGFPSPFTLTTSGLGDSSTSSSSSPSRPLAWQPLAPRANFRPFNRQLSPSVPEAPSPPSAPAPPSPPESLASALGRRVESTLGGEFSLASRPFNSFDASTGTTRAPSLAANFADDEDDLPTRQPLSRFRPTRAPSDDEDSHIHSASESLVRAATSTSTSIVNPTLTGGGGGGSNSGGPQAAPNATSGSYKITNECYDCICEASTNCNINSRCQTSDVRNTRCGMFLISYDQWLATGLSRELVTREALEKDAAADERAFYDCVTQRDCSHRLLAIYMQRNNKDCDKDGRIDCYDLAAIHHSGLEQCAGEDLLDSQYWGDFNACFGFGRR